MKKSLWLVAGLLVALGAVAEIPDMLRMNPQEIRIVNFDTAVKSADPSSACVEVTGLSERRIKITARNPGAAHIAYVLANGTKGMINVEVQNTQGNGTLGGLQQYLQGTLEDMIGIDEVHVNSYLDVVEVKGEIGVFSDWNAYRRILSHVEERWPGKVVNSVKFKPTLAPLEKSLTEVLSANVGIAEASVVAVNELGNLKVVLSGSAYSDDDIKVAENVITAFLQRMGMGDVTMINNISKSDAVIEVEFTYFRLADNIDKELGLDLLNEIQLTAAVGASYATGQKPTYTGNIEFNPSKIFSMLEANGLATVASKQTVSVENGVEGTASFGGEVIIRPYATDSGTRADTERIPFGFIIKVTPNMRGADQVRLNVDIENSQVDFDAQSNDYMKANAKTKTTLDMPLNGMAVLAVNQQRSKSDTETGTPFLRKVPGVKLLFGKQAEKIIMAYEGFLAIPRLSGTPDIVNTPSVSARTDEILAKIERKLSE
jgi:hypothetical protein